MCLPGRRAVSAPAALRYKNNETMRQRCHLAARERLWRVPSGTYRGDIVGRLSLLLGYLGHLGRTVALAHRLEPAGPGPSGRGPGPMRLLVGRVGYHWTLTEPAEQVHLAPRLPDPPIQAGARFPASVSTRAEGGWDRPPGPWRPGCNRWRPRRSGRARS